MVNIYKQSGARGGGVGVGGRISIGYTIVVFVVGVIAGQMFPALIDFTTTTTTTTTGSSALPTETDRSPRNVTENNIRSTDNDIGWKNIQVFYGDEKQLNTTGKPPAQCRQDVIVSKIFGGKQNGFFIDLAANDAVYFSNTFKLERDFNWGGICVEPNPMYWRDLSYRKCHVIAAVIGKTKMEEVSFNLDGVMGGIQKEGFDNDPKSNFRQQGPAVKYYTLPFLEILQKANAPFVIDYLSLDVEGAEFYVMSDFPFDQYTFRVVTIERPDENLRNLMSKNGYELVCLISHFGESIWVSTKATTGVDREAIKPYCFKGEVTDQAKEKGLQVYA